MSALTIPQWSRISALVMTVSSAPSARVVRADWPIASRRTLPPPNFASSPGTVRSCSTRTKSSVSARRTRSPSSGRRGRRTAGGRSGGSREDLQSARRPSAASRWSPRVRLFRPDSHWAPATSTSVTRLASPGSKRTAVPAGMFSRMPNARARSNRSARFTSKKWKCEPTWMGRSPTLVTSSSSVRRPTLATMSPSAKRYSPGIMARLSGWAGGR